MVLEVDLHPFDLPGIDMLLRSSAILETFVIDLSRPHAYEQVGTYFCFPLCLLSLKIDILKETKKRALFSLKTTYIYDGY